MKEPVDAPHPAAAESPPSPGDVAATFCATLVDEWVRAGLSDAVISPGSRSTPMALALASHPDLRVHVHHDERSASFLALGAGRGTGRPAALVCTSGTAAAEFHAAVIEAHQAGIPMLVITADRPPELQGVGAPQTIDQRELYGSAVRWYCEPGPPDAGGAPWWRDLARDAWQRALGVRPGPVQLNLAFREPLVGSAAAPPPAHDDPPRVDPGAQWGLPDELVGELRRSWSGRRGVVVAGERAAVTPEEARAVHRLAARLGWPVLADGPSGCRVGLPGSVTLADPLVRDPSFAEAHRPEVVLRLGASLSSAAVNRWLATSGAFQVGLDRYDIVPDPDGVLALARPADVLTVVEQLLAAPPEPAPMGWRVSWDDAEALARAAVQRVLARHPEVTEPAAAVDLVGLLGDGGELVASSSMPVRDLEWYAPARVGVRFHANRGANGIDGVVSTAVGVASQGRPTALLVGDVAFLHDTNGLLGLAARPVNLVIVVVHNDGGGIFSFLSQHELLDHERFEQLFGTPHGVDLVGLARAHGVAAEQVATRAGLQAAVAGALTRGGPRVVVARTDRDANVEVHRELAAEVAAAWARRSGHVATPGSIRPSMADGAGGEQT